LAVPRFAFVLMISLFREETNTTAGIKKDITVVTTMAAGMDKAVTMVAIDMGMVKDTSFKEIQPLVFTCHTDYIN